MAIPIVRRTLKLALVSVALLGILASPALAHVEIASSDPQDGSTVAETPAVVTLEFSVEASIAGDGVFLRSSDGSVISASAIQTGPTTVTIEPVEILQNGSYVVSWTMKAGDAHPASGVIEFRVENPRMASAAEPIQPDAGAVSGADQSGEPDSVTSSEPPQSQPASTSVGDWLTRVGRWVAMTGGLVAVGALAFAATSLVGTRREVEQAGYWVRRAGILVVIGTLAEALGASMVTATLLAEGFRGGAIAETVSGPFGVALLLRGVAGLAMLHGMSIAVSANPAPMLNHPIVSNGPGNGGSGGTAILASRTPTRYRFDVHKEGYALAGVALFVASYLFDGHTVISEPALAVRIATLAHVAAAGVWLGGVLLMAHILTMRHRQSVPLEASKMAIRFSVIAGGALAVVAVAGGILTISILDSVSELFTTSWGRILLVKLLAVGAAASIGAYNHFQVVPELEAGENEEATGERLRHLVKRESLVLVGIVAITAILVGAAS